MDYELVTTEAQLEALLDAVGTGHAALDFETTGLDPENSEVRLAQICNDDVLAVVDFWSLEGGKFAPYAHWFEDAVWIAFNAGFEYMWFDAADAPQVRVIDVAHARRAIMGGDQMSLAGMLKADLHYEMEKAQQLSNWAAPELSAEQLRYAADDGHWTWKLWLHWRSHERATASDPARRMLDDLVPVVHEMKSTGLLLDIPRHSKLVDHWREREAAFSAQIRQHVGEDEVANIGSRKQWSDFFGALLPDKVLARWPRTEKAGHLAITTKDCRTMASFVGGEGPLSDTLHAIADRFSSSGPNAQQLPRDRELLGEETSVRRSFLAPPGKLLVSLDYSGIELKVLALLSEDEQLLYDCIEGDLHSEVASYMVGHRIDKKTPEGKEARSKAKGVSFGIIYGSGALGLSGTLRTSVERAQELIDFWADRYPKAFGLRHTMMEHATADGYLPMIDGGSIWLGKKPDLPKCANYPVQRAALSVMARALIRHKSRLEAAAQNGRHLGTRMAATIHDAMIDEALREDAEEALQWMKADMLAGYLDIFPGAPTEALVEGGVGPSWGELEDRAV